ncbi:hypothetical protein JCM6882_004020 [Rhodosporidiobolus microsporus]
MPTVTTKRSTRRLDPTRPAFPLPNELVLRVMEEIAVDFSELPEDKRLTLARCCLVSRTFASLARPLLYKDIELAVGDLRQSTRLFKSLEQGYSRHVRELTLEKDPEDKTASPLRGSVFEVFKALVSLRNFWMDEVVSGADLRDLVITCLPRWTSLTSLSLRSYAVPGEPLLKLPNLRRLEAGSASFRTSTRHGPPPPFHLRSLGLSAYEAMDADDLSYLLGSSTSTLSSLDIGPLKTSPFLDLSPFSRLLVLEVVVPPDVDDVSPYFDSTLSTLRTTPDLESFTFSFYNFVLSDRALFDDRDFLRALPTNLLTLALENAPPVPTAYLHDCLAEETLLPHLEMLSVAWCDDKDDEDEAEEEAARREEIEELIAARRPDLELEWERLV